MRTSLSRQLTYRIMAVVLVMMAIITVVVYYTVRSYMLYEAEERYLGVLLKTQEELRRRLSDVYVAVKNNVYMIERDIDYPDSMAHHAERIVRQNQAMSCCGILFERGYYPDRDSVFATIAIRYEPDTVSLIQVDSTYHSHLADVWVPQQMRKDEADWTEPYLETASLAKGRKRRLLTSYASPIHNSDGHAVAMCVGDLSLESLRQDIIHDMINVHEKFEQGCSNQSYFFILDSNDRYVMHPDEKRMFTPIASEQKKVFTSRKGIVECDFEGQHAWVMYRTVKFVEWTLVIVVPEEVVYQNARTLNTIILLVSLLGMATIYFICRRQIKDITTPVTVQQAAIERELKIANGIQMAMLPKTLSTQESSLATQPFSLVPTLDLYASLTPAREVGGDLYDYFLRAGRLYFCIGDVTGKGVPAALLMAVMRAMFRSEARRAETAVEIVKSMNRNLSEEVETQSYFVTMFVGILDLNTGRLDYCNAAHEVALLSGIPLAVKPNLPVGALSDWDYEGQQAQLRPDDMLFLFTDGLSEAKSPNGHQLGRQHVQQLVREHSFTDAKELIKMMEDEVHRHAAGAEQSDDVTMLAVRWHLPSLTIGATMEDIGQLQPYIEKVAECIGIDQKETKRLRLAVEEAVANVINYSHATTITLRSRVGDRKLLLSIDDDGDAFDPTAGSATDLSVSPDKRPPGGLGIILLHTMTDSLSYERTVEGHNVLTMSKNVNK